MEIELWHGNTKALISPEGAWLTNLSDENGDILFPKRQLTAPDGSVKIRGGSHVCLPNFGPGGESGLPQHGFGRTEVWEVVAQTEGRATLRLVGGAEGYQGLVSTLSYALGDRSLDMQLELHNTGESTLRVAPAFHPYFALAADEEMVRIDDTKVKLESLADMQLSESTTKKQLATLRRTIRLESPQLTKWAQWTDQLGKYVCVEPTLDGYAFLQDTPAAAEQLAPNETVAYAFRITW